MRCHVAFTPAEAAPASLGIVVDVMRATSTIAQALACGYRRVLCCAEIDDALALREELGDEAITGGERDAQRVDAFDAGASPREFREPRAETLILSTTNGTRSIVAAAAACDEVVLGALLNLDPVARHARERLLRRADLAARRRHAHRRGGRVGGHSRVLPAPDRRHQRTHVRPARARGGHRVGRAGEHPRRRAEIHAHGRPCG
jgi:phosphosulfolactate phosphohydrolase-like enzyme